MALYVDSALLDDITDVARTIPLAGTTTNPTILLAAREKGQRLSPIEVRDALLRTPGGRVFLQPGALDDEGMYRQALELGTGEQERVVLKIPTTPVGLRTARRLKADGYHIAFTAVTSVAQAYTVAQLEPDFIIPYFNRLERSGIDASERISRMAQIFQNQHLTTRILVASIKSVDEAERALRAGAHDLTIAPQVLLSLISDSLSEEAAASFARDWLKMNKQ